MLPRQAIARFGESKPLKELLKRMEKVPVREAWPPSSYRVKDYQHGYLNFYSKDSISPYIPVDAQGPWIVTQEGRLVYDAGGYGMLGLGHNEPNLLKSMGERAVMANIMTPSVSQKQFWKCIEPDLKPHYSKVACLNSGSEANTLAIRMANYHQHPRPIRVALQGSFHGRTEDPARLSGSCQDNYAGLASGNNVPVRWIRPNDINHLEETFDDIEKQGYFPELTIFEPVMGEGMPGLAIQPPFYRALRTRATQAGGMLLADSVQAGFRCTGELSITRYPGFETLPGPDMETFSKAINAGQYPVSILAMNQRAADLYRPGLYGNTMTSCPRALNIVNCVLDQIKRVKNNIPQAGDKLLKRMNGLESLPCVETVQGTGLLVAIHLKPDLDVMIVERKLRLQGLNVIHGGENAIRLTPWFHLGNNEIQGIYTLIKNELSKY